MKTGRFLMRKGTMYARYRRTPVTLYVLIAIVVGICLFYVWWFTQLQSALDPGSLSRYGGDEGGSAYEEPLGGGDEGGFSAGVAAAANPPAPGAAGAAAASAASDPVARAAWEALYEDKSGRKLRTPAKENPALERTRVIVLSTEGGRINTGVWPGWGGDREVTLNWAAAGVRVQKYCSYSCKIVHDESMVPQADAIVMELVNHPKFGLESLAVQWPEKSRPNPRAEAGGNVDGKPVPPQLPLLGLFYYEPSASFPAFTLASKEVAARFDFTATPAQSSTLPVTLICPWGRGIDDFLAQPPAKTPGRLLAYFSEHGNAPQFSPFLDQLFSAAGADGIHAYVHRRNRDMPAEAGGDPYQLTRRIDFMGTYKFVLITEGVEERDFIEPEWSQVFLAGAVPVYLGTPNIADFAPGPRSYISARDFASGADLWAYIQTYADDGPGSYESFFEWKKGANAAYDEDERNMQYAVGTRQGVVKDWPKAREDLVRDMTRWPRPGQPDPPLSDGETVADGIREASKWGWRIFRQHLDSCVHYAECRLCEYVHKWS
jgi:hypothetical protein